MTQTKGVSLKEAPGPQDGAFGGHMRELQKDSLGLFMRMFREYGDIVRFRALGNIYLYMISDPDGIDYMLRRNSQNYARATAHKTFESLLGNDGLLTIDGPSWLRQRRLAQPAFHRQRIAALAPMMTRAADQTVQRWQEYENRQESFELLHEMMRITLQIVAEALFSIDVTQDADQIGAAFGSTLGYLQHSLSHIMPPLFVPTRRNREYQEARGQLNRFVYKLIAERRNSNEDKGDLLSMFLQARDGDTDEGMSDKQLHDEIMTMLLAGHETTATTLTWAWYLLSQNPESERRMHEEIESTLSGHTPTFEDLPKLAYTRMIIDETMRLYPPTTGVPRTCIADDEICGYRIPAKANMVASSYVVHRHPAYWEHPEQFDPERFTAERSAGRPQFAYFPFSGGPRQCIGNNFALMEATLILATIAQRYRVYPLPNSQVIAEQLVTLRPKGGLFVHIEPRS
ncbi:cytochrome P450 [Dictyobacter alpinus]|uniref:Cytochrome P450 n=1 Tax=Dictyobacter alpinus TaxID=2014873 RepID=A0A402BG66_9CHLR|nr:cytochrome P450 [Dictyobacter alpinus]GCE30270.1 cytochrome P450 [Dictyobacter alpinus]